MGKRRIPLKSDAHSAKVPPPDGSAVAHDAVTEDLTLHLRAGYPLLAMVTWEESRALAILDAAAVALRKRLFFWSATEGLWNAVTPDARDRAQREPMAVLEHICAYAEPGIYVLLSFHTYLQGNHPLAVRRLKDFVLSRPRDRHIVIVAPDIEIPLDLQKDIEVIDVPLPGEAELGRVLDAAASATTSAGGAPIGPNEREDITRTGRGLTSGEFENVLAKAYLAQGSWSSGIARAVGAEKRQILRKTGFLDYIEAEHSLESIGGLSLLKRWLQRRSHAFSREAAAFGLPSPRGLLMVGVQGCGKSLMAKAIARAWSLPLVKLDVGRLFAGLVGSSEQNIRQAIRVAESVAPVVLWIDEIEKGFAGTGSSDRSDAGTAARVFGTFTTWLQEKKAPVFVVATANDISQLPPELLRKGRFDEIFFVDLPGIRDREAIFGIHIEARGRRPQDFDIPALASAATGFSGAEIEASVIAALHEAFAEKTQLTTPGIAAALRETVPLSRLMGERVSALREWARSRARPAAEPE